MIVFPTVCRYKLGWLSLDNLIKHHAFSSLYHCYVNSDCVVFNPPINLNLIIHMTIGFSLTLSNSNCKTSFGQRLFRLSVADWWNSYTNFIIDASE